mmetsp:Transcript_464/g.1511  ORF Transcript_464/g.1511 Transcript_464/m.1511 type:complete len:301 (-) Transcript_464:1415-2317(-)
MWRSDTHQRPAAYPAPSSHGVLRVRADSNFAIDSTFCSVSPISSRPLSRQCLRKASTSNLIGAGAPSPLTVMVCASRSTEKAWCAMAAAISVSTSALGSVMGSMPFLKQLFLKISAMVVEITHRMPRSRSAHGACSRDDPQPKLSPVTRTLVAPLKGAWLRMNAGSSDPSARYRTSKKAPVPRPDRLTVFRNCFGMILSVSTFSRSSGHATPSSTVNLGMPPAPAAPPASAALSLAGGAALGASSPPLARKSRASRVFWPVTFSRSTASLTSSRTSVRHPVTAAAAAIDGLIRWVRPPLP